MSKNLVSMKTSRREFLRHFSIIAGCFVASPCLISCSTTLTPVRVGQSPRYSFPHGIASADPQPDAVLVWARLVDSRSEEPLSMLMQLAADQDFQSILVEKELTATINTDFTVRCFIDGLEADQWYYYRFITPDSFTSRTGRTRTAPAVNSDTPLNIAIFSCQNYERGFFNAYRHMIVNDERAPADKKLDLCIHVGDYIYENVNVGAFSELGPSGKLINGDGIERTIAKLPSGGRLWSRGNQYLPDTLDDYRYIYKSYLSDPSLQAARAWYPFVHIWDDHEVLNDYWQAYHPGGSLQTLKVIGNQAWFEYIPAILSDAIPGPAGVNPAKDFEFVEVNDVDPGEFDEDYLSLEPNTLAAINSMAIHRSLQWGKLADILLVDGRSYRGPRGLDKSILGEELIAYPKAPIDPRLIHIMNAGRTANNNEPPDTLNYEGNDVDNPRKDSPRSSMLGADQKQWLKDNLATTTARWKILCNNVPMMRFGFDTQFYEYGTPSSIYWTDSWDGYPVERNELMNWIKDMGLPNIVSFSGDRHAHYAGYVFNDYEADNPTAVIPELVGAGITADDRLAIQMMLFRNAEQLLKRTGFDGKRVNYYRKIAPAMNAWMLYGERCAEVLADTADINEAEKVKDANINPHLHYADNDAYGYYTVNIREDNIHAEFITIPLPIKDESQTDPELLRRVTMDIQSWDSGETPKIKNIQLIGQHNFLGIKS